VYNDFNLGREGLQHLWQKEFY